MQRSLAALIRAIHDHALTAEDYKTACRELDLHPGVAIQLYRDITGTDSATIARSIGLPVNTTRRWCGEARELLEELEITIPEIVFEDPPEDDPEEESAARDVGPQELNALGELLRSYVSQAVDGNPDAALLPAPTPPFPDPVDPVKTPPAERFEIYMDVAEKLQKLAEEDDPIQTKIRLDFPENERIAVLWASCFHLGGRYTFHAGLRDILQKLFAHPRVYIALLGDNWEGFSVGFFNKRSQRDELLPLFVQRAFFESYLDQIAEKVIGLWPGQHDVYWEESKDGTKSLKDMALARKIPYFDGQGYIQLHVGSQVYHVAAAHFFSGHSMYNMHHPHTRAHKWQYTLADLIVQGDKHTAGIQEVWNDTIEAQAGLRPAKTTYVQVGTLKSGNDPYTIRSWSPGQMIFYTSIFDPSNHDVRTTWRFDDVLRWLDE